MHVEHSEKVATDRLSPGAALIVIGLCSLTAWGVVLSLGLFLTKIAGR
jgi:hypothetical protein